MRLVVPKIVFLSSHLPYPPISGGRRREYELIKRISRKYDIHLCTISKTFEEDCQYMDILHNYCVDVRIFKATDTKKLAADLLESYPHQVLRNCSVEASKYLVELVSSNNIDIIHVEGFYLMQHIPEENQIPVLLTEQNIEYLLWKQKSIHTTQAIKKREYLRQHQLTKIAETVAWNRSSLCVTLTEEDKYYIKRTLPSKNVRIVSDGVDHLPMLEASNIEAECNKINIEGLSILFVGNFDYEPNIDAAFHLCYDILPLVRLEFPKIKLYLVGNATNPQIKSLFDIPNVIFTGRVSSLLPYLNATDIFVCPLRIGGGVKVKILEALYHRKPIVSSSIGVQGIPIGKENSIHIEDDPVHFAHRVVYLLQNPEERKKLEMAAVRLVNLLPSWDEVSQELCNCYDILIAK